MSRTLFVNQKRVPVNAPPPAGTIQDPFPTIQMAVNFAATLKPTTSSPVAIAVMQGIYRENVVIDVDGIILRGLGGGTVRIHPSAGSAVTITNCTPASVKSFAVSKDASVLQDNGKTVAPAKVELVDLALESAEAGVPTICIAGFPKRPPLGKAPAAITLSNCLIHHTDANAGKGLLAYFAEYIRVRHNCEISAPTEIFNCLGFLVDDTDVQSFVIDFDSAGAPAPAGLELGLVANNASFVGPTAEIRGSAGNTLQPSLNTTFFDLVVRDTATFNMIGGCANDVTMEGGANWTADGVHVLGNVNIAPGPGAVTMNAGRYMGALTDPSAKLVRKLGN